MYFILFYSFQRKATLDITKVVGKMMKQNCPFSFYYFLCFLEGEKKVKGRVMATKNARSSVSSF